MAGRRRATLGDGPLWLDVTIVLRRPQSHYKTDGSLSLAGQRSERPTKKPDADNAIKLVADALQGFAFRDDAQLVTLHCEKRWANAGEDEHTRIVAGEVPVTRLAAVRRAA
jgi:Holliday junction resolvase RusA-like endonuclease